MRAVHHRDAALIDHRDRALIDLARRAIHARILVSGRAGREIVHFVAADLIAGEVVARQENRLENRMVGVNAGVDVGDDASAREIELLLGPLEANHARRGLIDVTRPDSAAVILNRSRIHQGRGRIGSCGAAGDNVDDLIQLGIHHARQSADDRQQQVRIEQVGSNDDEEQIENAVDRGKHLAVEQEALALQAVGVGGANDQAIAEEQAVGADQPVDRDIENARDRLENS